MNKSNKFDWITVQKYHDNGHTVKECKALFGISSAGWYKARVRKQIVSRRRQRDFSTLRGRTSIRRRILTNKLLPYKCSKCGIKEWNKEKLSLVLDHINGINNDNKLENLRWVCPNCNSQLPTFAGRNIKH